MRRLPATGIGEHFELTDSTRAWLADKAPTVEPDGTLELFIDKARAGGWMFRDWQAAFRNYVRMGPKFGGVVYREGRESDPRWQGVLCEARRYGFRPPQDHESPKGYETALGDWKQAQKRAPVVLQLPIKRVLP